LAALVGVFLILFASRVGRLNTLNLEKDEVWSVWQTLGSIQDTIRWTPFDWSPTYYLLVHIWQTLTGIHPFTLRVSSILVWLVSAALLYRVARRCFGVRAAFLALIAFGGLGYTLFLSTLLRGYIISVALWLAALWVSLDYLPHPDRRRGALLAALLVGMFYIHVTGIYGVAALGAFTLVYFGPRIWRAWVFPALIFTALCLPEALSKVRVIGIKNTQVNTFFPYVEPGTRILNMYRDLVGARPELWAAVFLIAAGMLLDRARRGRAVPALLVWLLAPIPLLWLTAFIDAYNPRHLAWLLGALALWIGWGLALLPRAAYLALCGVLLAANFDVIPLDRYEVFQRTPLVTSFDTLRQVARASDALLIDPRCSGCPTIDPEEWDYFMRAYFPQGGLPLLQPSQSAPFRGYRRIWYVAAAGHEDPATLDLLLKDRAPSTQFGAPDLRFRLFELPPESGGGVPFANGMHYYGAEILHLDGNPGAFHAGETIRVRLFWGADPGLKLDYSIMVGQIDPQAPEVGVKAHVDGPPAPIEGPPETSRWQTGRYYVQDLTFTLSYPLKTGEQTLVLAVYQWWDGVRIEAPGLNADRLLTIGSVHIKAY
jgi:hypothetical protein